MNRTNRRRQNKEVISKKVIIRCLFHNKPVFDNETCSDLLKNHEGDGENICKNCKHSF